MKTNSGVELWRHAKKVMPGGTQLLSKRSEMFLPDLWPSYYKKAKGVDIWDLDGNHYVDMSIMGVGTCILGYADDDVNAAAKEAVDNGSMATLNCPEEVELADVLLGLHPWADMVRFARTAGEALTIAVRIARAATGKDDIAFCGYHGWHDWYLSANLADDKNLDGHLLPGLKPNGVPRCLIGSSTPFNYNRLQELEEIIAKKDIGVIVVEPMRHYEPEKGFLEGIRKLADEIGAALIFDEVTSGWRVRVGGIHQNYNVLPDIAVYGKAMSNGFPMAAVVGKGEVMDAAQESFISSTYWTDRVGPAASLATIDKMIKKDVPAHLVRIGNLTRKSLEKCAKDNDLRLNVTGIPSLPTLGFDYGDDAQAMSTLFTQEMLKRGFLASKSMSICYCHEQEHVQTYIETADVVFAIMSKAAEKGNVYELLEGPVAQVGFKRLN